MNIHPIAHKHTTVSKDILLRIENLRLKERIKKLEKSLIPSVDIIDVEVVPESCKHEWKPCV